MISFNPSDFNVQNAKQKNKLRDKLNDLGKSLIVYAQNVCPNITWDN
ncbi:hypothetical protein OW763_02675 [Clostridium aestuarii]|uniref:Uncharacterized protein n=1 Tax=Clostridium aestuarii TaxID=338193 RepID=A0ABT4CW77_9CLOT|nr:hypothetical protein [Clostridium aestuarii]MCY6483259.1 hypothetical protein [Clostridium aestuarii]